MKASGKKYCRGFYGRVEFEADTFNIKDDTPTFKCRDKQATCTDNELELYALQCAHAESGNMVRTESVHTDSAYHHQGLKENSTIGLS